MGWEGRFSALHAGKVFLAPGHPSLALFESRSPEFNSNSNLIHKFDSKPGGLRIPLKWRDRFRGRAL